MASSLTLNEKMQLYGQGCTSVKFVRVLDELIHHYYKESQHGRRHPSIVQRSEASTPFCESPRAPSLAK